MVALHLRHQDWPAALQSLLEGRGLATTQTERVSLQLEIAQLHEQQLSDSEAAVADYLHALEFEPTSAQAFRALERLYLALQRPAELLRAYEQRLTRTEDSAEKVELLFKSAELWKARSSPARADRSYEAVLVFEPANIKALEALAEVRREEQRWEPLAQVLSRHVETNPPAAVLAELCAELGDISSVHLKNVQAARRWWTQAVEAAPSHRSALRSLCELDQQEGRWAEAVLLLNAQAQLETQDEERTSLYFQAGVVCEERLKDITGATMAWKRALQSDTVHLPSLRRLRAIFLKTANWPEYEQNLAVEAKRSPIPESRCAAAVELAQHYESRVRDAAQATAWYQHAFTARPDALEAALPLSTLLCGAKQWSAAATVLQATVGLLEKAGGGQKRELAARLSQWAFAQRALRRPQEALGTYERALQVDSSDVTAMRGQLEVLEELGQKREGAEKLSAFLAQHARSLEAPARVELYLYLGQLHLALGAAEAAMMAGEKALEGDAVHVGCLRLLISACDKVPVYEKAVVYRQRLAAVVPEAERYLFLFDAAVLADEKLSNPTRAIEGYLLALKWKANAKEALQRLHVAYRAAGHNRKAIDTLKSVLAHPELSHGEWKRETLALADLTARAMGETERTVDVLEAALDKDVGFIEALQVIEALLGKNKQWENLDGCYQRMIRRLGPGEDSAASRAALFRAVGELRLHRIKDRDGALKALKEGALLTPDDPLAQEAFAELALDFPEHEREALAAYLRVLPTTSSPQKACLAVAQVAKRHGDVDTQFIAKRAAATLATLADVEPLEPPAFRAPVSDQAWRKWLLHPGVSAFGELMALIYEQVGPKYALELGDLKLHPTKHAVDLAVTTHPAIGELLHVARELGFEAPPRLYSPYLAVQTSSKRVPHHDDNASLRVLPTFPLSFVVGERFFADMNAGTRHALIARGLSYLRPELAMSALLTAEQLELVVEAGLSLGDAAYVSPVATKALKAERKRLEKALSDNARAALSNVVTKMRRRTASADVAHYLEGVGHTALRAALLVAGDFAPVRGRLIPEGVTAEPMIRQMLLFALSGGFHALRVETGTAVRG